MSHWKKLELMQIKQVIAGTTRCVVRDESGAMLDILVVNLTPSAKLNYESLVAQRAQVDRVKRLNEAEQRRIRTANVVGNSDISTSRARLAAIQLDQGVAYRAATETQLALDKANLQSAKEDQTNLVEKLDAKLAAAEERMIYAMNTGRKMSGLDLWDCGRAKP